MTRPGMVLATALLALACTLAPTTAEAHPKAGGPFGLGIILYEPTGLTGKYWLGGDQAIDFHLGLQGLGRHGEDFGIYVDYLFHFELTQTAYFALPLYLGPGGAIIFADDRGRWCNKWGCQDYDGDDEVWLSARMPFGVAFLFTRFAGEAFVELALQLWLVPFQDFDIDAALGFRFYF